MSLISPAQLAAIRRQVGPKKDEGIFRIINETTLGPAPSGAGFSKGGASTTQGEYGGRCIYIGNLNARELERLGIVRADADYIISLEAFTPISNTSKVIEVGPSWAASTRYQAGQHVIPSVENGRLYLAVVSGETSGSQPVWPTTVNATVVDGGVTWRCLGLYRHFEVIKVMGPGTYGDFISTRALCNLRQL